MGYLNSDLKQIIKYVICTVNSRNSRRVPCLGGPEAIPDAEATTSEAANPNRVVVGGNVGCPDVKGDTQVVTCGQVVHQMA